MSWSKHFYKDLIGRTAYTSRFYKLVRSEKSVVFAYHSISNNSSPVCCTPHAFKQQCRFFSNYFDVVSVGEILRLVAAGKSLKGKIAITFDDGYKDNVEAAEILSQFHLPAAFFVATRFIGSDHTAWWDERDGVKSRWMDWDDVRELHTSGFSIGAHTQNHIDLGKVDADEAMSEITGSVEDLEREIGERTELFAYPYGGTENIKSENLQLVKDVGLKCSFSCHGGVVSPGEDLFSLRRLPISSWHISEYHLGAQILRDVL